VRLERAGNEGARVGRVDRRARGRRPGERGERQPPRLGAGHERGQVQRGQRAERLRRHGDGSSREVVAAQHAEHDQRAHADGRQDPHRATLLPCIRGCSREETVTASWQSCYRPSHAGAPRATTAAMAFLRRHNRALLCIAAGVALSALTYQQPF
jgi:hypothetical protein